VLLEELIPIANLESKGLLKKGVLSPILPVNHFRYIKVNQKE